MKENLKIHSFAVILRNIIDLGKPQMPDFFEQEEAEELFSEVLEKKTEWFEVIKYVFGQVCTLAKKDIVHLEFPCVQLLDLPKVYYMEDAEVLKNFEKNPLHTAQIYLSIHRSGVLQTNIHIRFENEEGYSVQQAIDLARLNLRTLAIQIPENLAKKVEISQKEDRIRWIQSEKGTFLVASLKDLTTELLRPVVCQILQKKGSLNPIRDNRCISSTLVQVYKTSPECKSIEKFVEIGNYGKEIRGLGSLDRSYEGRSDAIVEQSFCNLSVDEEVGVFTFGLSDLMLFDTHFGDIVEKSFKEKSFKDPYAVVLYNSSHYSCLLEWVYLEKYLIDLYSRLLSQSIAREKTTPEQMLIIQKQSMHDLIAYQSGITPYPSREEFLEKARNAHRIPEMQEKLEKKRDLATDYVIQEYTLRTNKSIHLVNIFVSASAVFALMQVILEIQQVGSNKSIWGIVTTILFALTLIILWGIDKFYTTKKS
ncbi:MAG: hypothetical protein HUU50_16995 [Candidatus Brocadiae bacterium]|nr:hypothetical protein [Candidatus Brocadiia bacterium]